MAKKTKLGLPAPRTPIDGSLSVGSIVLGGTLSAKERDRMRAVLERSLTAMEIYADRADYAAELIGEIDRKILTRFKSFVDFAFQIMHDATGTPQQEYIDEFAFHLISADGMSLFATREAASRAFLHELITSPYPPAEKKSLLQRLRQFVVGEE